MNYSSKYLKYKVKYKLLKNQLGGIDPDFKMFESCISNSKSSANSSSVEIRTREQLIDVLKSNGSITEERATFIHLQLKIIEEYIKYGERRNPKPNFLQHQDEIILREIAKMALMVCLTRGQYPRENQLIAVLLFFEGHNTLLQAGTGQGKSLIVAMIAILQTRLKIPVLVNDTRRMGVHVITTTDDLATDAIKYNMKLFTAYNIVARKVSDGGNPWDIIYGTPYDFEGQALREASDPTIRKELLDNRIRLTIILDESDSHLVDGAMGRVMYPDSDPDTHIVKYIFKQLADMIIVLYKDVTKKYTYIQMKEQIINIFDKYITTNYPKFINRWNVEKDIWIKSGLNIFSPNSNYQDGVNFIMRESLLDELEFLKKKNKTMNIASIISDIELFLKHYKKPTEDKALKLFKSNLLKFYIPPKVLTPESQSSYNKLISIINDIQNKNADQTYMLITKGAIQYYDKGTGQIINNMKYSDGIQEFLEYKNFGEISSEPTISVRSYSLFRYVRNADVIFGLSGTVGLDKETMDFQRKVWRIETSPIILPEFAVPKLREIIPVKHLDNIEDWNQNIFKEINKRKTQPILLITINPEAAKKAYSFLSSNLPSLPLLYVSSADLENVNKELVPGNVVITTNLGGRGSDYSYNSKLAPKGLHVIIGFDSDEERILAQARGRAGRAGNPGTWRKISFGPKLQQKPNIEGIKIGIRNAIGEDIIFEIYLFIKKMVNNPERVKILMSWLSKPDVRKLLLKHLTDKYTKNEHMNILPAYILTEWLKEEQPTSKYEYDERNKLSIELGNYITPYLKELKRIE